MKIIISCIGKLKFDGMKTAADEYSKRIGAFAKVEINELAESKVFDESEISIKKAVKEEGERLIRASKAQTKIALSPEGKIMSSEEFSKMISKAAQKGDIAFMIGGSHGISDEAKNECDEKISFSKMVFPHQLFRVMLLEQIYRAFKINAGQTYHK